ncbi:MAG TPA: hypothetical protein VFG69_11325 [Nannocystaceae bacterium]|nr:hypothetical protein [Nannocystaceae bacterium]
MMRRLFSVLSFFALTGAAGCNAYRLEPPKGFAEVDQERNVLRMKSGDDVGLNLRVFPNVDGGTLDFWSADLVRKLGRRSYVLVGQSPARSKNRVAGTRFDFSYVVPGTESETKFYSVVLFVTDEHVFALQIAGDDELRARHLATLDAIARDTKVRGCKAWTDVCRGPQPGKLSTPPPTAPETDTQIAEQTPAASDG